MQVRYKARQLGGHVALPVASEFIFPVPNQGMTDPMSDLISGGLSVLGAKSALKGARGGFIEYMRRRGTLALDPPGP